MNRLSENHFSLYESTSLPDHSSSCSFNRTSTIQLSFNHSSLSPMLHFTNYLLANHHPINISIDHLSNQSIVQMLDIQFHQLLVKCLDNSSLFNWIVWSQRGQYFERKHNLTATTFSIWADYQSAIGSA